MSTPPPKFEDINIIPPSPEKDDHSSESRLPQLAGEESGNSEKSSSSEDSDTETEMSDRKSEKHLEGNKSSSSKSSSHSSFKSGSNQPKKDDWSDVVEPDERRRIQNRIAQRKFREKAKEKRETEERDAENQQRAGLAYTTPISGDIVADSNLSGLPWGGVSMRHIIERGQTREVESQRSSQELSYFDYRTGGGSVRGSDPR